MLTETRIKLTPTVLDRLRDLYEMEGHASPFERNAKWLASHIVEDYKVSYDNAYDAATGALTMAERERRALSSEKPLDVSAIDLPALRQEFEEKRRNGSTLALDFTEFAADRLSDALTITDEAAQDAVKTALIAEEESKAVSVPEATDTDDKSEKKTPISHRSENLIEALSDVMLAREVGAHLLDKARYVHEWKNWGVYDETTGVWKEQDESAVLSLVSSFLEGRYDEMKKKGEKPSQIAVLLSKRKAGSVLDLSKGALVVSSSIFDKNRDVILTGKRLVVELRTGETREVKAEDFFTKRTPVSYKRDADSPLLHELFTAVPEEVRSYFIAAAGQSITGHQPRESVVFFLTGNGSNGKSSIKALMTKALGQYAASPSQSVLLRSNGGSEFSLMAFKGLRTALFEELPQSRWLDANTIKRLAGTPVMRAAEKFHLEEEFEVISTIFISTNHLPQVAESENGTWRRLRVINFPYTFVKDPQKDDERAANAELDPAHIMTLDADDDLLTAALALFVREAQAWYARGMRLPETPNAVLAASTEWKSDNDRLSNWAENHLSSDADDRYILCDDLYASYKASMTESGTGALGKDAFFAAVREHDWFRERGLTIEKKARVSSLSHNEWLDPAQRRNQFYEPRQPSQRPTIMRGVSLNG